MSKQMADGNKPGESVVKRIAREIVDFMQICLRTPILGLAVAIALICAAIWIVGPGTVLGLLKTSVATPAEIPVRAEAADLAPLNLSLAPATKTSRVGEAQVITAIYGGQNGVASIANMMIRVGERNSQSLYAQFSVQQGKLFFLNESGQGYRSCLPGSSEVLRHSRGALICSQSSMTTVNNTLVLKAVFEPTAGFVGHHDVYMMSRAQSGEETDFVKKAEWTVSP